MVEDTHLEEIRCSLFQSDTFQTICLISQGTPILKPPGILAAITIGILTISEASRQELSFADRKATKSLSQSKDKT